MKALKVSEKSTSVLPLVASAVGSFVRFGVRSGVMSVVVLVLMSLTISVAGMAEAHADRSGEASRVWVDFVRLAQRSFGLSYELIDLATNQLDAHTRAELEAIALDQAQVWGDTILEGDFVAEEAVSLDKVQKVMHNGEFLGYRITYSSKAWDTSGCRAEHAGLDPDCIEGRIVESSFVSPDLFYWFRDDTAFAEFVPRESPRP